MQDAVHRTLTQTQHQANGFINEREINEEFQNPSSAYLGKPFRAWNGKLEEDELRRQIRLMKRMGLGGFFMRARASARPRHIFRKRPMNRIL